MIMRYDLKHTAILFVIHDHATIRLRWGTFSFSGTHFEVVMQ